MAHSNFSEIRRVRHEMSQQAGHDVRRLAAMFDSLRDRYCDRLVDHGAMAEQSAVHRTDDCEAANGRNQ